MIAVLSDFIAAVDAKDLPTAAAALGKVQDASVAGEWTQKDLDPEENERLLQAVLEFSQLEIEGPVVENPDALIEAIHDALDVGDGDLARERVRAFQGSMASGGPSPSEEGKHRFIEAFRRKGWAL